VKIVPVFVDSELMVNVSIGPAGGKGKLIPTELSDELKLRHGTRLTPDQAARVGLYLGEESPEQFLPPGGTWQYQVIPISESGGLATAKGTAERMEGTLNRLAQHGWELVTTSERDSRWMGGETVMLVVKRFVSTQAQYSARFKAEENLRRRVLADLDGDSPTSAES
jgi:Domain of unknown function (DUF4177)